MGGVKTSGHHVGGSRLGGREDVVKAAVSETEADDGLDWSILRLGLVVVQLVVGAVLLAGTHVLVL